MSDTKTMLQAIFNGQSAMKQELLGEIKKLDIKINNLEQKVDNGFETVNKRLDMVGKSVAYLEDDAPTREEYDNLEKRVKKVEKKLALA